MSQKSNNSVHMYNISYWKNNVCRVVPQYCIFLAPYKRDDKGIVSQEWHLFYNLNFSVVEQSLITLFHLISLKVGLKLVTKVCSNVDQFTKDFHLICSNLGWPQNSAAMSTIPEKKLGWLQKSVAS